MKKILFFIPSLGGGGAEKVLVNLVNGMDKSKFDVTVQTIFDVGINRQYLSCDVRYIPGLKYQFPGNSKVLKLFSPNLLYKFFIKEKYDVVVSYLEGPAARIVSGCNDKDTKLVSWIHVELLNLKNASSSFRSEQETIDCYSKFNYFAFVSKNVQEDFLNIFDVKSDNSVIYNTVDSQSILEKSNEEIESVFSDEINVVSVGRLMEQKGYDRLIKVHKKLIDEGLKHHIYILGTGVLEEKLKVQVRELDVCDTFHFLGYRDNPYKYVKNADLFVCSSRREGFSTAITESLIVGTPVVSTNCSGAYELLGKNNEYGIVVENSTAGIYSGLKEMLTKEKYKSYRDKAVLRGKEFLGAKTIEVVEDMIENVLR